MCYLILFSGKNKNKKKNRNYWISSTFDEVSDWSVVWRKVPSPTLELYLAEPACFCFDYTHIFWIYYQEFLLSFYTPQESLLLTTSHPPPPPLCLKLKYLRSVLILPLSSSSLARVYPKCNLNTNPGRFGLVLSDFVQAHASTCLILCRLETSPGLILVWS